VYVGLGSNLGDRDAHLSAALHALREMASVVVHAVSPIFETDPVGPPPQGPYLNAVVQLTTSLTPRELLDALLTIESREGRTRSGLRDAPRTLDLDLLLFGERTLDEPGLIVPHPRLAERGFVLEPLCELAPRLLHPTIGETIGALAERVRDPGAVRWYSKEEETAWRSSP
jgi:2-amino-4-hydroxy-6-hydroxymethyldihydropteridine diphosphokinase